MIKSVHDREIFYATIARENSHGRNEDQRHEAEHPGDTGNHFKVCIDTIEVAVTTMAYDNAELIGLLAQRG